MKEQEIEIMDEKEKKLIGLLEQFDYDKHAAKVLVYVLVKNTAISKDIERAMDMRQPEVCLAIKQLRNLGMLSKKDMAYKGGKGKGRPIHQYTLKKSPDEIRASIEKGVRVKIKILEGGLKALNTLMSEVKK